MPWRTIRGRRVNIGGRRYYSQPRVYPSRPSFPRRAYQALPFTYSSSQSIVKARLPAQQPVTDAVKKKLVDLVRERYGDTAATAAGVVIDQVVAKAFSSALPSITAEAKLSRKIVEGSATVEFNIDPVALAGVKVPEGIQLATIYAKTTCNFRGNLQSGRLTVSRVKVDCGVRAGT